MWYISKRKFEDLKSKFLEDIESNIIWEIEYYEQVIHVCFDWYNFYHYSTCSFNSWDQWVYYIYSYRTSIDDNFFDYSYVIDLIKNWDDYLNDLCKKKSIDLREIQKEIQDLNIDDDKESNLEIINDLYWKFDWFFDIVCEIEKDTYHNYLLEGNPIDEIEEIKNAIQDLDYEKVINDIENSY